MLASGSRRRTPAETPGRPKFRHPPRGAGRAQRGLGGTISARLWRAALGQRRRVSLRSALRAPTPTLRFSPPSKAPQPGLRGGCGGSDREVRNKRLESRYGPTACVGRPAGDRLHDRLIGEVQVLHPQPKRLHDAQPGSVEQPGHPSSTLPERKYLIRIESRLYPQTTDWLVCRSGSSR